MKPRVSFDSKPDINYLEIKPDKSLSPFVKYFWMYEHLGDDIQYTILPDACFDLMADFEEGQLQQLLLTGIWTKPTEVTVTKGTIMLAVRFKLPAAEYLFGREIKTLLNTTTALPLHFWNINTANSDTFPHFAGLLSAQMNERLNMRGSIDDRKIKLFDMLYQQPASSVEHIAESVGWSSRQMNRYFNEQFGFSLKTFMNMLRCNDSYHNIANGNLYPQQEYFDQSHFIKEIKKYTGATPRELWKNKDDRFLQLSTKSKS